MTTTLRRFVILAAAAGAPACAFASGSDIRDVEWRSAPYQMQSAAQDKTLFQYAHTKPPAKPAPSYSERRYELGPILVVEHRGELYIDQVTIVVLTADRKAAVLAYYQAGFPKEMGLDGGMPSMQAPRVMTVDEYVKDAVMTQQMELARWAMKTGTVVPATPQGVLQKLESDKRDEVLRDLDGHAAVAYRYVGTKMKTGR